MVAGSLVYRGVVRESGKDQERPVNTQVPGLEAAGQDTEESETSLGKYEKQPWQQKTGKGRAGER